MVEGGQLCMHICNWAEKEILTLLYQESMQDMAERTQSLMNTFIGQTNLINEL